MRFTSVKGINDDLYLELGSNVSIICEIMEIGRALDAITFEAELSGEEVIDLMKRYHIDEADIAKVNKENRYIVTAYDW